MSYSRFPRVANRAGRFKLSRRTIELMENGDWAKMGISVRRGRSVIERDQSGLLARRSINTVRGRCSFSPFPPLSLPSFLCLSLSLSLSLFSCKLCFINLSFLVPSRFVPLHRTVTKRCYSRDSRPILSEPYVSTGSNNLT